MLLSASFTAKFGLVFVLTLKSAFSRRFHFQDNRKSIGSSKKTVLEIFKIALRLRDRHVFMWRSVKILSIFSIYFNFETNFLENENFFQKTGALLFSWTHEDWKGIISIWNCHIRSQYQDKQNGNYKMGLSQRKEFCQ